MKLKHLLIAIMLLATAVLLAACTPESTSRITDYESLVDNLLVVGAAVEPAGEVSQDFFSVEGQVIKVNGADVQVFDYGSEEAASDEADVVSSSGSTIGTTMVTWVATPHFYRAGWLIVLYVGEDDTTTALLEEVLGPQFAGG